MKKVLYITNGSKYDISYFLDSFSERDDIILEVAHFWLEKTNYSFIYRVFNKLKIPLDNDNLNKRLLDKIKYFKPDIIFIVKGNSIYPWTLKTIKKNYPNIKIVSFSNDNMSLWSNKSIYYQLGINYYDLVVSINIEAYRKIEEFYKGKVLYIDKSYSKKYHKFLEVQNKQYDCLFIGTYEKERFETMSFLAQNGIKVDIFGGLWNKADISNISKNLTIHFKELVGEDYNYALANSKIVLGFLRKVNLDTQTSRTIEIPASGGFMIMEYTENQDRLFTKDIEMIYFRTKEELLKKIKYYNTHQKEALSILRNARLRCETDGYEYNNRINEILKEIDEL